MGYHGSERIWLDLVIEMKKWGGSNTESLSGKPCKLIEGGGKNSSGSMRGDGGSRGRGETNTVDNVDNFDLNIFKKNSTGHLVDVVATESLQF